MGAGAHGGRRLVAASGGAWPRERAARASGEDAPDERRPLGGIAHTRRCKDSAAISARKIKDEYVFFFAGTKEGPIS